jgi:hypothetical protein
MLDDGVEQHFEVRPMHLLLLLMPRLNRPDCLEEVMVVKVL